MMADMTEGDGVAVLGVRVRLGEGASASDVRALRAWLEREKTLEELLRDGSLRIVEQTSADTPQGQMGPDLELVLELIGELVTVATLADYTARAVRTWQNNRRRVQGGEPPEPEVRPLDRDGE